MAAGQVGGLSDLELPHSFCRLCLYPYPRSTHQVDAVVVGADRVVANGDTANKIGTYALAILASHHNVSGMCRMHNSSGLPDLPVSDVPFVLPPTADSFLHRRPDDHAGSDHAGRDAHCD